MKTNTIRVASGAVLAFAVATAACGLAQLDAIGPPAEGRDSTADSSDAERSSSLDGMDKPDAVSDGSSGNENLDARARDSAPEDAANDAPTPSSPACEKATDPVTQWTFDTSIESWISTPSADASAPLTWTGSTGDPTKGALELVYTPPSPPDSGTENGVWLDVDIDASDLSKRTVSARVWLDEGSLQLLTFVQTQTDYAWGDDGVISLPTRKWTCVSLPVSTPVFSQPDYDPTQVIRIGLEMLSDTPFRVYVDTVSVE
jgi:hypothetical protein